MEEKMNEKDWFIFIYLLYYIYYIILFIYRQKYFNEIEILEKDFCLNHVGIM